MFPIPKAAKKARKAYKYPKHFPSLFHFSPFTMVYIGPPQYSPASLRTLYFTASMLSANFVDIPIKEDTTIQKSAPGPPRTIADATPTIFPVPIVAASSVIKEENGVIPSDFSFEELSPSTLYAQQAHRMAKANLRRGRKRIRNIRNIPVPNISASIHGPQTKESTFSRSVPSATKAPVLPILVPLALLFTKNYEGAPAFIPAIFLRFHFLSFLRRNLSPAFL